MSTDPNGPRDRRSGQALFLGIVATLSMYVGLFLQGDRFFVVKTFVLPAFLLYAAFLKERLTFVTDWLPFLTGTVLFDALRGAIYLGIMHEHRAVHAQYVIHVERAVFRTPALPAVVQAWRTPWLDAACVVLHASHFMYFLLFGLIVWHYDRRTFLRLRQCLLLVMAAGLTGYYVLPTVPPWMASQQHLVPTIVHIIARVYSLSVPELYGALDANPVAAMPSLHAAFPVACAIVGWGRFGRRVGLGLAAYAVLVMFAVVYLGEHYATDLVAGIIVAGVAGRLSRRLVFEAGSFKRSLAWSGAGLALTCVVLAFR